MAAHGGGGGDDNPVHLNVAPMVDIIFCLCIFFMCSFHFKQLEGKFESWLPKDKGPNVDVPFTPPPLEEIRVRMAWDPATGSVVRRLGARAVAGDDELIAGVLEALERHRSAGILDLPVLVDAEPVVPWKEVIGVMDLLKRHRVTKIELAEPWPLGR